MRIKTKWRNTKAPHNFTGLLQLVDAFQEAGEFTVKGKITVTSVMHLGKRHLCIMIPLDEGDEI